MAKAGYQDGYNVNSNPLHHLYAIVDGKTAELTGLIDGTCFSAQRSTQKNNVVNTYEGNIAISQSANDSGTATVTTVEGFMADRLCNALFNEQFNAKEHKVDLVYTNESTGLIVKAESCYAQTTPQSDMSNQISQIAYPLITKKYSRVYDGDSVEALMNS